MKIVTAAASIPPIRIAPQPMLWAAWIVPASKMLPLSPNVMLPGTAASASAPTESSPTNRTPAPNMSVLNVPGSPSAGRSLLRRQLRNQRKSKPAAMRM